MCECACGVCVCMHVHVCACTTQSREGKTENTSRGMGVQDTGVSRQELYKIIMMICLKIRGKRQTKRMRQWRMLNTELKYILKYEMALLVQKTQNLKFRAHSIRFIIGQSRKQDL